MLLLAAVVGVLNLNNDALRYDELLALSDAGGARGGPLALAETWQRVAERGPWPPGFEIALANWGAAVGWHHLTGRALPLFAGLIAIAWMYRLGREVASQSVGLSAAALLGLSAFFLHYLHELRGYTMYALFATMCVWAYWRIVYRRGGLWTHLLFFLSVVGLLYVHYFAALTLVAVAAYHLLIAPKTWSWWRIPILLVAATALFVPWAQTALQAVPSTWQPDPREPLSVVQILQTLAWSFSNGLIVLLILALEASILYVKTPRERRVLVLSWLWVLSTLGIALLANEQLRVIFHVRYLMAALPALALVGALGLAAMARRGLPIWLFLGVWLVAGIWNTVNPAFMRDLPGSEPSLAWDDLAPALDALRARTKDDDVVLYHVAEPGREWLIKPMLDYYTGQLSARYGQLEDFAGSPEGDAYFSQLLGFLDGASRVWFVSAPEDVPSFQTMQFVRAMNDGYVWCERPVEQAHLSVDFYARRPPPDDEPAWRFADQAVGLYALDTLPATASDRLSLLLGWRRDGEVATGDFAFTVSLQDGDGNSLIQASEVVPDATFGCTPLSLDVSGIEPGNYALSIVVRSVTTGVAIEGQAEDGTSGTRLTLQPVSL